MITFLLKRIGLAIPTLLGAAMLIFFVVRLTGDPAAILLPLGTPESVVNQFRIDKGLDQPLPIQFEHFLLDIVRGNFGTSIRYGLPVSQLLLERLPATLELALCGIALATVIALPLGIIGGLRHGSKVDYVGRFVALGFQAIPVFYLGILLILIFGVWLELLPTVGNFGPVSLILPSVTLAAYLIPIPLRVTRGAVLDVASQNYIRSAKGRGIPRLQIVLKHMLKNSMIPVVTVLGLQIGASLSGAIITEAVFGWPGIGRLLVDAISTRDFPVVQGVVIFATAAFIVVNLIVDVAYKVLDPRIRLN